jgi:diaminobutyrate-2-oxoglutarate transaminase
VKFSNKIESEVKSYCRAFPEVFTSAKNDILITKDGDEYIDFLAGAGALNYGHNNTKLKKALLEYIKNDGPVHTLDMFTEAKEGFLKVFDELILNPRKMNYKVQFPGPTGTNAVEAALKIARNYTGRQNIVSFTNGFHGCTLGSVSCTGNSYFRKAAGVNLDNVTFMPYEGFMGEDLDTAKFFESMLDNSSSGLDMPAAVILETVQGEGGLAAASKKWLQKIAALCNENDILLIVDDIQAGCGRTGTFFSFEKMGITPDVITLSKSLSGYGLPMSLVLMKPKLDIWQPGEHNGTFRGHNLAFITAAAAIKKYWKGNKFSTEIREKSTMINDALKALVNKYKSLDFKVKGRGMMIGIDVSDGEMAGKATRMCFDKGLIIERSGPDDQVIKFLMPLTVSFENLIQGLKIVAQSLDVAVEQSRNKTFAVI